ncbi:MAG: AAA family ATPase [Planctomycetaceae bacterium]
MYEAFFGLRSRPFSPLPRVDTFVPVAPLREPLNSLIRCIEQDQGIGVLTSPAGSGKTLLCRKLYQHFREIRRSVLLTTARFPTRRALLQAILFELKHPYVGLSEQEARLRVLDLLQSSPHPMNRMLLIVDEAHLLSAKGIEELRTLTDYEINGTPSISLILSGQLELEELLTEPCMSALNQRVGCHVCIEPLTFEESGQYIRDRLRFAGSDGLTVFTPEAVHLICTASEGNPRRINQLCDHSLLIAFAEEKQPVDEPIVRAALLDLRELPLHWNTPLDLSSSGERNPLEDFVQKLDSETKALHDEALVDSDTELDLDNAHEFDDAHEAVDDTGTETESTVFEVGASSIEHPIDQLFQVEKFIVPSEFQSSHDLPDLNDHVTPTDSAETYAFEPPSSWEEEPARTQPWTLPSAPSASHELSETEEEYRDELDSGAMTPAIQTKSNTTDCHAPAAYAEHTGAARPMGFEELVIDDTYALIDRLCESQAIASTPRTMTPYKVSSPPGQRSTASNQAVASSCCGVAEKEIGEIDIALREESHESAFLPVTHDFGPSVTPSQSALLENQLLDFINEISQDVRQFRDELNTGHVPETLAETMEHTAQEVDRLLQLSMRRAQQVQYDIVEPDSDEQAVEQLATPAPFAPQPVVTEAPEVVQASTQPANPPVLEQRETHEEKGRYAQLFTRLQRQRRQVETVIKQTRRDSN